MQEISLLGSTGSIGCSTLDVVRRSEGRFIIAGLSAHQNLALLADQIAEFSPRVVGITGAPPEAVRAYPIFSQVETVLGSDAAVTVALESKSHVVAGMVGIAGLLPVYESLKAGKTVVLANKESLVCAGRLLKELSRSVMTPSSAAQGALGTLIPIDSEHSALWQLSHGYTSSDIASYIITASGGPFLRRPKDSWDTITPAEAVKHPTWSMGAKISIDSATLMNKALEVIEAHWLFDAPMSTISVLVHPQSIVHGMLVLNDGALLAHLSDHDMRGAIAYGLTYPGPRMAGIVKPLYLPKIATLSFEEVDEARFPAIRLAHSVMDEGGAMPSVFNSANEAAVALFLAGNLSFASMLPLIEEALERFSGTDYASIDDILMLHDEVTAWCLQSRTFV